MNDSLPIPLTSPLTPAQKTTLINLVRRAARAEIMPRFRNLSQAEINAKTSPQDLVTEADIGAEAMIARGVQKLVPHALVVGEEAASRDRKLQGKLQDAEIAFLIDPVDGTWNFANGLTMFGVIVAVTRFGKPVFGLLYDPVMDDWIIADEANGTLHGGRRRPERPVKVSEGGSDLSGLSGFVHIKLMPEGKRAELAASLPEFANTHILRCSCHEYRMLAQGAVDFALCGILQPWDHAAGIVACQQAGGVARMLDGRDYTTGLTEGYVLAAPNQATWDRLRDRFDFLLA